jgi:hypothetical protein
MCAQFWFLRDLMVVMILSPILYVGLKYLKIVFIGIFGLMWLFGIDWNITGLSIGALFFFSVGAYLAITKLNFVELALRITPIIYYFYLVLSVLTLYAFGTSEYGQLRAVTILSEIICIVGAVGYYIGKGESNANNHLSESSFFIYAYHQVVLAVVVKYLVVALSPMNDLKFIIIFITTPIIITLFGVALYWLMKKTCPSTIKILTGGR